MHHLHAVDGVALHSRFLLRCYIRNTEVIAQPLGSTAGNVVQMVMEPLRILRIVVEHMFLVKRYCPRHTQLIQIRAFIQRDRLIIDLGSALDHTGGKELPLGAAGIDDGSLAPRLTATHRIGA